MIGQTLTHYRVLEQIGAGGMGVVYRARDLRLERDVAIKVLPEGALSEERSRRQFRREALALSRLSHPHIETVHDFDSQGGLDFLVMEYLDGSTLSQRLVAGPLSEAEALTFGVQIAEALESAHEQGVVHCDLKPGNVMITPRGEVKVLDFGLSKILRPALEASETATLSEPQFVAGTLPYMAPEQLRAGTADARVDLYATGALLYEMTTGRRPFEERLSAVLVDHIFHVTPPAPGRLNPRLSPRLEEIILKCLEKDPERRYQSARELLVDLERLRSPATAPVVRSLDRRQLRSRRAVLASLIGGATLVVGALVLRLGGWWPRSGSTAGGEEIRSLAVLPLDNFSGDPNEEYFVDGMTDELTTRLAQIGSLRVIARTSAMRYKGAREPVSKIGRELNVDAIVEGSVLRSGDRVRVTAQLIRAATQGHLWAQSYERAVGDVLSLQSEVAQAIAREIQVKLTPGERERLGRNAPVDPLAHEAYLRGQYLWNQRTVETVERSIGFFQEAIGRDPNYALAYAGLAAAYGVLPAYRDMPSREIVPKEREAAMRALELDPSLGEVHANLAGIKSDFEWDPAGAEKEYRLAIELAPNSATAHQWYGEFLSRAGRHHEAISEYERAAELDPLSPIVSAMMADGYYLARQYDRAIDSGRRTVEMFPDFKRVHVFLGNTYLAKGNYEEAISEYERAGLPGQREALLRAAFRASGSRGYWRKLLQIRLALRKSQYVSFLAIAVPYAQLGERDQAFSWLEHAYQERDTQLTYFLESPLLDGLRADPRFRDLMNRAGLRG